MREVCFLIVEGDAIVWADVSNSPSSLPDSRVRWQQIWNSRDELVAIVHSHPSGPAAFSAEDESTMEAIDAALGRPLWYAVVAPDVTIARVANGPVVQMKPEAWWADLMRLASGMRKEH
jgi:proteasome lid subunit RPN8/RPN11